MKYKTNLKFLLVVVALAFSLVPTTTEAAPMLAQQSDVIVYGMPYDYSEFSLFTSDSYGTVQWTSAIYAALLKRTTEAGRDWAPDLAGLPVITNNGLTYEFTLKSGLKFSNGNALTTADVEFGFMASINPNINTNYAGTFLGFLNASSIEVIDDLKVKFTFNSPYAFPLTLLASIIITDQETFQTRYDSCLAGTSIDCLWNNEDGSDAIGAGPFMVDNIDNVQEIVTLKANPNYYNADEVYADTLVYQFIATGASAYSALSAGEIHILDSQYIPDFTLLAGTNGVVPRAVGDPNHQELAFNNFHPHYGTGEAIPGNGANATADFYDARLVRLAMSHLIDRDTAVNEYARGLAAPATTFMPDASLGWDATLEVRDFNVTTARDFMTQAGYNFNTLTYDANTDKYTTSFFDVTLMSPNTNPARNQWAAAFEQELPKIGIGVTHLSEGWSVIQPRTFGWPSGNYTELYDDGGFDMYFVGNGWGLDWIPTGYADNDGNCVTGDCANYINFDVNETYTEIGPLTRAYMSEPLADERALKSKALQAEIYFWEPTASILYFQSVWGTTDDVGGIDYLLISVSATEWDKAFRAGFTKNAAPSVSTTTQTSVQTSTSVSTQVSTVEASPFSTVAFLSGIFVTVFATVYFRRRR